MHLLTQLSGHSGSGGKQALQQISGWYRPDWTAFDPVCTWMSRIGEAMAREARAMTAMMDFILRILENDLT